MLEERFSQIGSIADPLCGFAGLLANGVEVFANELGHIGARQVTPEVFDRIEFRRVGWQVLGGEPPPLMRDPVLDPRAAMSRQPVPQQNDLSSANMPFECLEVFQDLR